MKKLTLLIGFVLMCLLSFTQERIEKLEQEMETARATYPNLDKLVDMSVQNGEVLQLIRAIGREYQVNVAADHSLKQKITYDFSNVPVHEVFVFLCKQYDLTIEWTGGIMYFKPYVEEIKVAPVQKEKPIQLVYDDSTQLLSGHLTNDSLLGVRDKIIDLTGVNLSVSAKDFSTKINQKFVNLSLEDALEVMLTGTQLTYKKQDDNRYQIVDEEKKEVAKTTSYPNNSGNRNNYNNATNRSNNGMEISMSADSLISLDVENGNIKDIVIALSELSGNNYYLFTEPKGTATLSVRDQSYENLLMHVLNGSDYTYKQSENVFLIGERNMENLRESKVYVMKYRTVENVVDFIPAEIKKGVEVKAYDELNAVIMSGSSPQINEIESFLISIDQVVPLVLIEVSIVSYRRDIGRKMGVKAGWEEGKNNSFTLNGTDQGGGSVVLNGEAINNLLKSFEGYGLINLGQVSSDFYLQLDAMESVGILKKESSPKLSALNGHEATMSVSETVYYINQAISTTPGVNPIQQQTNKVEQQQAEFKITIKPFVSGNEYITLNIEVTDSDFENQTAPNLPPNQKAKTFTSMIRVQNGEMVLLGGLNEKSVSKTTGGVPFLAKIPVIKWFFSHSSKSKNQEELNIFIKPTVIY